MAVRYVSTTGAGANTGVDEANAWTMAQATANVVAGDVVHCLAGTYTTEDSSSGAVIDLDVAGTLSAVIEWRAYTTTIDDFVLGDVPPVIIDAGVNLLASPMIMTTIAAAAYNSFRGFRFKSGSSHGVNGGTSVDSVVFSGCKFDLNGGRGIQFDNFIACVACEFTGNNTNSVDCDNSSYFYSCTFHNEGVNTLQANNPYVSKSLFYNNGDGANIRVNTPMSIIVENTFDGDGQSSSVGVRGADATSNMALVMNNIFFDLNSGVDFSTAGAENIYNRGYNLFVSCTTQYDGLALEPSDIDGGTTDPFTDSTNRDYTLASGSAAEDAGIDAGVF